MNTWLTVVLLWSWPLWVVLAQTWQNKIKDSWIDCWMVSKQRGTENTWSCLLIFYILQVFGKVTPDCKLVGNSNLSDNTLEINFLYQSKKQVQSVHWLYTGNTWTIYFFKVWFLSRDWFYKGVQTFGNTVQTWLYLCNMLVTVSI